jgi:hypothetical protein
LAIDIELEKGVINNADFVAWMPGCGPWKSGDEAGVVVFNPEKEGGKEFLERWG